MFFKYLNRLQYLDQLIRQKRTGNAIELACKLKVSRRQVYNCLEELKDFGLQIDYNRHLRSFTYQKSYEVKIIFEIKELSPIEWE